jgi:hypothetical protein
MHFLADESCDFAVVRALREAGFDVMAVSEPSLGTEDHVVIDLAIHERRMVITEDKDFGQLVYAEGRATGGVLFLRFPGRARALMAESVVEVDKTTWRSVDGPVCRPTAGADPSWGSARQDPLTGPAFGAPLGHTRHRQGSSGFSSLSEVSILLGF